MAMREVCQIRSLVFLLVLSELGCIQAETSMSNNPSLTGFLKVTSYRLVTKELDCSLIKRVRRSPSLHPCSHGENWCEDPLEYPETFLHQIINSSHPLWPLLKENSLPHHHHHHSSHRKGRVLGEASRPACQLEESFVRPRAARNKELEWRFIINDLEEDTEYQQVVIKVMMIRITV